MTVDLPLRNPYVTGSLGYVAQSELQIFQGQFLLIELSYIILLMSDEVFGSKTLLFDVGQKWKI